MYNKSYSLKDAKSWAISENNVLFYNGLGESCGFVRKTSIFNRPNFEKCVEFLLGLEIPKDVAETLADVYFFKDESESFEQVEKINQSLKDGKNNQSSQ